MYNDDDVKTTRNNTKKSVKVLRQEPRLVCKRLWRNKHRKKKLAPR